MRRSAKDEHIPERIPPLPSFSSVVTGTLDPTAFPYVNMSIFSKIRGAKKAAEKHKGAKTQEKVAEEKSAPYHHVPTHAAIDALSGAPSSWKAEDRSAIKAHHKRRSALNRNSSNLSTIPTMNRTSSYNGSEWGLTPVLEPKKTHLGHPGLQSHLGYQGDAGSPIGKSPLSSNGMSSRCGE